VKERAGGTLEREWSLSRWTVSFVECVAESREDQSGFH